jgi:hypothetical protein
MPADFGPGERHVMMVSDLISIDPISTHRRAMLSGIYLR